MNQAEMETTLDTSYEECLGLSKRLAARGNRIPMPVMGRDIAESISILDKHRAYLQSRLSEITTAANPKK